MNQDMNLDEKTKLVIDEVNKAKTDSVLFSRNYSGHGNLKLHNLMLNYCNLNSLIRSNWINAIIAFYFEMINLTNDKNAYLFGCEFSNYLLGYKNIQRFLENPLWVAVKMPEPKVRISSMKYIGFRPK